MHPFFAVEIVMRRQLQKPPLQQQQRADDPAEESVSNTGLYVATVASLAIGVVGGAVVNRMFGAKNNDMKKEEIDAVIENIKVRGEHLRGWEAADDDVKKIKFVYDQLKHQDKHIKSLEHAMLTQNGRRVRKKAGGGGDAGEVEHEYEYP